MPEAADPQVLFETFLSFDVKYAGLIPEIPTDMDATGRADVLRVIDQGKKSGLIPWQLTVEQDAVLKINAYSIRILSKRNEELQLCAPVHQIAAVCYVQEDSIHILGIKIGEVGNNKEISDLAVLHCSSAQLASEICNVLSLCFQLVFSESTVQYFDKKMVEGAGPTPSFLNAPSGSVSSADHTYGAQEGPSFISGSKTELHRIQPSRPPPQSSTGLSESDHMSICHVDPIQEFMRMLHAMLTTEENKGFAVLLVRWRQGQVPLAEFLQKVLEIFGADRKHLLARMRPFINEKDSDYFESFLEQSGVSENAEGSLTSYSPGSEFAASQGTEVDTTSDVSMTSTVKVTRDDDDDDNDDDDDDDGDQALSLVQRTPTVPRRCLQQAPDPSLIQRQRSSPSATTTIVVNEVELLSATSSSDIAIHLTNLGLRDSSTERDDVAEHRL